MPCIYEESRVGKVTGPRGTRKKTQAGAAIANGSEPSATQRTRGGTPSRSIDANDSDSATMNCSPYFQQASHENAAPVEGITNVFSRLEHPDSGLGNVEVDASTLGFEADFSTFNDQMGSSIEFNYEDFHFRRWITLPIPPLLLLSMCKPDPTQSSLEALAVRRGSISNEKENTLPGHVVSHNCKLYSSPSHSTRLKNPASHRRTILIVAAFWRLHRLSRT